MHLILIQFIVLTVHKDPLCKDRSLNHIYGYMLSHPNDPRWLLPKYNNSKFTPNENLHAESSLNERRSNGGNLDSLR